SKVYIIAAIHLPSARCAERTGKPAPKTDETTVYVVEVMRMAVDFIENLEAKMNTVRTIPTIDDSMSNLNNCVSSAPSPGDRGGKTLQSGSTVEESKQQHFHQ
ncbi:unnamed protein product, partial [Coregonus sp. 'balchen']